METEPAPTNAAMETGAARTRARARLRRARAGLDKVRDSHMIAWREYHAARIAWERAERTELCG